MGRNAALALVVTVLWAVTFAPTANAAPMVRTPPVYIVGQDLDALRGYFASRCCVRPDGATAYVSLYKVLSKDQGFGGIGLNAAGEPIHTETEWGSGPVSAYKTATQFGVRDLAVGLSITNNELPTGMGELLAGRRDAEIRQIAKLAKHVKGTMFLRIGYEYDGAWNKGYEDRNAYIQAWRRIVDILRHEGATNIEYVWQASASPIDDIIDRAHEDIADWYPGDDYVDWVGFSWFLSPDEKQGVGTYPAPPARVLMDEAVGFARRHHKPAMIAESAPQGFDIKAGFRANISPLWDGPSHGAVRAVTSRQIWDSWYAPLFAYMAANRDVVRGLAYINCDWDNQRVWGPPYREGFWGDTRLQANRKIAGRWNQAITQWRNAR